MHSFIIRLDRKRKKKFMKDKSTLKMTFLRHSKSDEPYLEHLIKIQKYLSEMQDIFYLIDVIMNNKRSENE